ncbi:MAG TPA: amidohydrolase family protein [Phycisphaerae bacterium]|nr:amidohydrolase family protein [Phycisphaerae bacterium]HOM51213.1 amidohydrolase family protein [Phycisphaerae bacterium]HON68495.1 amidohydrolase family protein [Phycisphaerae bacterium]HOQ85491.1 amidohydrolase family protein [Phycisphaerae bacterium]HPP25341.1 amidohydrolase family protein [Phycisphaerae bacterium]
MRIDINACFGHWPYWDSPGKTADDLVALMDRNGIEQAACMSLRGMFISWRDGNIETLEAAKRFADRLIPMATISPFLGGNGDALRRCIDAGMRGVRLYPSFHNYPLDSAFVDDICTTAAACSIPVMIPTRPMMNWRFKSLAVESVGAVAARHPGTSILISGPNYLVEYQALVKVMQRCPNVFYEISCLQGFESVCKLVAEVGAERVLFGTGAVLNYPACNVSKLENARITGEQRAAIFSGNAHRLLNLGSR